MIPDRAALEQQRDQALRDIIDLDRQVADNELPVALADGLRGRYESAAARAITALESVSDITPAETTPANQRPHQPRGRLVASVLTATAAVVALLLLPQYVGERPAGGFVTGNEVGQAARDSAAGPGAAPTRDLATVSDSEMEAVIAANPDVIDMRLALAERYLDEGQYEQAARHYAVALDQQPDNARAQAHYGWLLLQLDQPQEAMRYVEQALVQDPANVEALWFKANIALYGLSDPARALSVLAQLQQRAELTPEIREQVAALVQIAQQQQSGDR